MQIRTRLTLQFLLSGGAIMVIASVAIFYASVGFRQDDFYNRLKDKARNTAKLFLVVHEMDAILVNSIQNENPAKFHNEKSLSSIPKMTPFSVRMQTKKLSWEKKLWIRLGRA